MNILNLDQEILGIDAIALFLKVEDRHSADLIDWKIHFNLPMRKKDGIFVSRSSELKAWKKEHAELINKRHVKMEPALQYSIEPGFFAGLEKIKIRRSK